MSHRETANQRSVYALSVARELLRYTEELERMQNEPRAQAQLSEKALGCVHLLREELRMVHAHATCWIEQHD